jgi:hypothetical protein
VQSAFAQAIKLHEQPVEFVFSGNSHDRLLDWYNEASLTPLMKSEDGGQGTGNREPCWVTEKAAGRVSYCALHHATFKRVLFNLITP